MTNILLQTIETDLAAGESWLEQEAVGAGLFLWNTLKGAFIALGPTAMTLVTDVLTTAVAEAAGGKSIEQIEADAMNTTSADAKTALITAGSGVIQTLIAGIKAQVPAPATTAP